MDQVSDRKLKIKMEREITLLYVSGHVRQQICWGTLVMQSTIRCTIDSKADSLTFRRMTWHAVGNYCLSGTKFVLTLCAHKLIKLDFVTLSIKWPKWLQDNVGSLLWRCQLKSEQCRGIIYSYCTSSQESQRCGFITRISTSASLLRSLWCLSSDDLQHSLFPQLTAVK